MWGVVCGECVWSMECVWVKGVWRVCVGVCGECVCEKWYVGWEEWGVGWESVWRVRSVGWGECVWGRRSVCGVEGVCMGWG